ncbi:DUF262 domain-containing protein [Streptomyces prasinus]|uniref:DUF262 domain-containing protein n=1 Tax=Streptomyces prasinus TaxID=67345 RepID=UPI002F4053BE
MSLIYQPSKQTIGQLLSDTKKTSVPDYQRDYSWTASHVDYFWQDVVHFADGLTEKDMADEEYFLGSMVRVDLPTHFELLDGQQRLATAVILLSAIRDHLRPLNRRVADKTQDKYIAEEADRTGELAPSLRLSRYDRDYFRRRIQEESGSEVEAKTRSQRLINEARNKFDLELANVLATKTDERGREQWLIFLRDVIVDHLTTVTVTCASERYAASIFETLNDRGLGLSTVDLLRNFVLRQAAEPDREEIIGLWHQILDESSAVDVDDFLRHYWTSRHGDIKSQRLYRAIRERMEEDATPSLEFMRDLADAHKDYVRIISAKFQDARVRDVLQDVVSLKAKMLYPLFLSGLASGEDTFSGLADAAITYYTREGIVAKRNGSQMERIVFSAAVDLYKQKDVKRVFSAFLRESADDNVFEAAVSGLRGLDAPSARYLLKEIEMSLRNGEETKVGRPPKVHVEHVYPQRPRSEHRWASHAEYVGKLGNLTLLSRAINTRIKNAPFVEKRQHLAESELLITQEVASHADWNEATVDSRQRLLGERIKKIWAWPNFVVEAADELRTLESEGDVVIPSQSTKNPGKAAR